MIDSGRAVSREESWYRPNAASPAKLPMLTQGFGQAQGSLHPYCEIQLVLFRRDFELGHTESPEESSRPWGTAQAHRPL